MSKLTTNIIKSIKNYLLNFNYLFFALRKVNTSSEKYIFITGADSSHFKSAMNCIISIKNNSNAEQIIFWDLGCSSEEVKKIKALDITYRVFPYQDYPEFYNIKVDAGKYAWKSSIIKKSINEFNLPAIWFDAGNILYSPHKIIKTLVINGFYSPYSKGRVKDWTYKTVINHFKNIHNIHKKKNLNGACVCFNPSNIPAMRLLNDWDAMSSNIDLIAPKGSSRLNHRQDQSLLTLLAYKHNLVKKIPHGYLGFSIHNDVD